MDKRIIFIMAALMMLSSLLFFACGDDSGDSGSAGEKEARWGDAVWGTDSWNP